MNSARFMPDQGHTDHFPDVFVNYSVSNSGVFYMDVSFYSKKEHFPSYNL